MKLSTKQILKYLVIAYILYLIYNLPRKDWEKGKIVTTTDDKGKTIRYAPGQSYYIQYMHTWWSNTIKEKGITGIIDENILAPLGIQFEDTQEA